MIVNHFLINALVLQSHDCFSSNVIFQHIYRLQKIFQRVVKNVIFTDGTLREGKANSGAVPSLLKNQSRAVKVENVTAKHLYRWRARQSFGEADHTHVVAVLRKLWLLRIVIGRRLTFLMQARQAVQLVHDSTAEMTASEDLRASIRRIFLALLLNADISNCQQPRIAVDTAEATTTDGILRIANDDVVTIAKLDDALQRFTVGESEQPKQFNSTAALVKFNFNRFFFLLAHRSMMIPRLTIKMQKAIAVATQSSTLDAFDHRVCDAIVVIDAKRSFVAASLAPLTR